MKLRLTSSSPHPIGAQHEHKEWARAQSRVLVLAHKDTPILLESVWGLTFVASAKMLPRSRKPGQQKINADAVLEVCKGAAKWAVDSFGDPIDRDAESGAYEAYLYVPRTKDVSGYYRVFGAITEQEFEWAAECQARDLRRSKRRHARFNEWRPIVHARSQTLVASK